ncbi:MAG: hypothetical protein WAO28_01255 [Candidatus Microsaccharimonas sp.]
MATEQTEQAGSKFLHSRDPKLHHSDEVNHVVGYLKSNGEKIPNEPVAKIGSYITFLAHPEYVNDGLLTGDSDSMDRQLDGLVIRASEVPVSYFDLQRRIAREQGRGEITITGEMRSQMIEAVQQDQRHSLERWANYLTDPTNANAYPNWFKKYAFENMLKLGTFNKETHSFSRRSTNTVAPFVDLNPEALAHVADSLIKHLKEKGVSSQDLAVELQSGNFAKLYANALIEVMPSDIEALKDTQGSWKKYGRIEGKYSPSFDDFEDGEYLAGDTVDDETARELAESLQGHGTGWCTAGYSTAAMQLSQGDFYVYYTKDHDGDDTTPRIAIRMEDGEVAEVRGIKESQNLEPEMLDIALAKLAELPGGDRYLKNAEDMKRVTEIDERVKAGGRLTYDEIYFLRYGDIEGFGWDGDPRVEELLEGRNEDQDFNRMIEAYGSATFLMKLAENDRFDMIEERITAFRDADFTPVIKSMVFAEQSSYSISQILEAGKHTIFTHMDATEVADLLYHHDHESVIRDHIEYFSKNTSDDTVQRVVRKFAQDDPVWTYTKREVTGQYVNISEVARDITKKDPLFALQNRDTFPIELDDKAVFESLIEDPKVHTSSLINALDQLKPGTVDVRRVMDRYFEERSSEVGYFTSLYYDKLVRHMDKSSIVQILLEHNEYRTVFDLAKKVGEDGIDMAGLKKQLLETEDISFITENLDTFSPEDIDFNDLAKKIAGMDQYNRLRIFEKHAKIFSEHLDTETLLSMLPNGASSISKKTMRYFDFDTQVEIIERATTNVRDLMDFAKSIPEFELPDPVLKYVAARLVEKGVTHIVIDNLEYFGKLVDHRQLFEKAMEENNPNIIVKNIKKFRDGTIDLDAFTNQLLDRGNIDVIKRNPETLRYNKKLSEATRDRVSEAIINAI